MNDFRAEPEELLARELAAAERVLRSGWYVLGKELQAFEAAWSAVCGMTQGVGVGNGMDALEIGLRALGIGPGDEVITTPMTAFATTLAILRAGAVPVFADIDPDTALLDPESVERCISKQTRAVLLVHLYGHVHAMERWTALCRERELWLLEDCAQAHLASWQGRQGGRFGAWGAFSFYPTKNLGAIGDAGMLVTNDAELARRARSLRNYGQSERYHHPELGLNSRLDELQAALLTERLAFLERFTERRRAIARLLQHNLHHPHVTVLPPPSSPENHVHHLFVVRSARRDELSAFLKTRGIESLIHYPVPVHRQKPCLQLRRDPRGLSHAETHASTCLSLPCHPHMTDAQVAQIVDAVHAFG
ncbi:MAG: pyridoxal-5-phosphate-dependent protein [Myxococcaceae bacterium]|nr:pyridoxal-5-phosphate-dependent protein [Myxococcaceae bacterium]